MVSTILTKRFLLSLQLFLYFWNICDSDTIFKKKIYLQSESSVDTSPSAPHSPVSYHMHQTKMARKRKTNIMEQTTLYPFPQIHPVLQGLNKISNRSNKIFCLIILTCSNFATDETPEAQRMTKLPPSMMIGRTGRYNKAVRLIN